ncbi:MAG: PEGA domain-containing protein, partial [Verrucomicrobiota bacterium]
LHHLHENGLTHRDVKPSNVIFVHGKPRLADIGLVAESGQHSFVGTEGFAPPEGPGSPGADLYSLGMVLYELLTGKDRLDFPELPEEVKIPDEDRKRWVRLNRVLCKCCHQKPGERFQSGVELRDALQTMARGRFWTRKRVVIFGGLAAFLVALGGVLYGAGKRDGEEETRSRERTRQDKAFGRIDVTSKPSGARVYTPEGRELSSKATPLSVSNLPPGQVRLVIEKAGYQSKEVVCEVKAGESVQAHANLDRFARKGSGWTNSFGMLFRPDHDSHLAVWPVSGDVFRRYLDSLPVSRKAFAFPTDEVFPGYEGDAETFILIADESEAKGFCQWLTRVERKRGTVQSSQLYEPVLEEVFAGRIKPKFEKAYLLRCRLLTNVIAGLNIVSTPPGAKIFDGDQLLGTTPSSITLRLGSPLGYRLQMAGYEDFVLPDRVSEPNMKVHAKLKKIE